jgi:spore maturation protein CgeB
MGHRVRFYEKDVPYYARHRDAGDPSYCDLVLYPDWNTVRSEALKHAADSDVVVVASYCPEGARISDEMFGLPGPMKVFYDLDTPVTFSKFEEQGGTEYLEPKQISAFDLILSFTGGKALRRLEEEFGAPMARPLYGCVDPDYYRRTEANPTLQCDLSYMGTYAPDRQEKLERFFLDPARNATASQFLLAGSLYPWEWSWPANVNKLDHVAPDAHPLLYSSSRLTLNITRKDMAESGYCPSGRFFEAAACGCPIVTDTWEGLESFFSDEEVLPVNSSAAVLEALRLLDSELHRFADAARQRTLDEHTGAYRAQEMLRYFDEARARSNRARSEVA